MKKKIKKAIVLGSSSGIGAEIADMLNKLDFNVIKTDRSIIDTSNLESVKNFVKKNPKTDVLVLNTGGPEQIKHISSITEEQWIKYFNQLFLSFYLILKNIEIKKNGFVFLISSHVIKKHKIELIISSSLRLGFLNVFNAFGKENIKKNITSLNIAPGPIMTKRLKSLNPNIKNLSKKIPLGKVGTTKDVSNFIKAIIETEIRYLNCKTIFLDGGISEDIF